MTIRRLVILQLILFAGLGSAYLVPTQPKKQPVGISMDLPESIGQWSGTPQEISKGELEELAGDTSFARKLYTNAFNDQLLVSIVLAGEDPDNSIHRPERCLPSQGWTILDSKTVAIKAPALPGGQLRVTRLHNEKELRTDSGQAVMIYNLNYYWFVGYDHITPSHIERFLMDIHDRIMKGYNQRWAYVTVASNISQGLTRFGRSEQATDEMIQAFISQLYPKIIKLSAPPPNDKSSG